MRLLERIRLFRPASAPAPAAVQVMAPADAPELEDADLEHVVGGLERVYVPGTAGY
ncbi:MAG: hypothetical protein KY467_05170 [Gemmatimonadetes bacterium]|nr:hypothetical protein [Gemmatimonadota bacterium]